MNIGGGGGLAELRGWMPLGWGKRRAIKRQISREIKEGEGGERRDKLIPETGRKRKIKDTDKWETQERRPELKGGQGKKEVQTGKIGNNWKKKPKTNREWEESDLDGDLVSIWHKEGDWSENGRRTRLSQRGRNVIRTVRDWRRKIKQKKKSSHLVEVDRRVRAY